MQLADAPTLLTDRLLLRPPTSEDLEGFYAFGMEEETMRFLGGVKSKHEIWRGVTSVMGSWMANGYGMFSVIERSTGEWIGRIGPWQPADWPVAEVGWGVRAKYAGKGFAYEAAAASIDYTFDELGWTEVYHCIEPQNLPSIKLAERLGSQRQRQVQLPPPLQELEIFAYGQTKEQWRSNKRS